MSAVPAAAVPDSPTAVAAFLRGVGRRAVVFAELQAGDAARGDTAVATAVATFRVHAPALELAHWPHAFWSALVDAPAMRSGTGAPGWAGMAAGPRAALLLRFAAGLGEAEAARVLGIGMPAYRLALRRALPALGDADAMAAQLQQRLAAVPVERLGRITLAPGRASRPDAAGSAAVPQPAAPRRLLALLWILLAGCVLAFAATYAGRPGAELRPAVAGRGQPLPPAAPPAARYGDEARQIVHRDFALLVDTDAAPFVRELEFYSWLAAQADDAGPQPPPAAGGYPAALPAAVAQAALETDDAPL